MATLKAQYDMEKEKTEKLEVEFYEATAGWLRFKIIAGNQKFENRFSEVYDPLLDFKHWLEAIAIGVQQTSFDFDNEGSEYKFDLNRVYWGKTTFTITDVYGYEKKFLEANIERQQLVEAFYLGLLNFTNYEKFKKEEWEVEYLKEKMCRILEIDEDYLKNYLVQLNKNELGEILFNANPQYEISYPQAKDKNEEWNMFIQDISDKEKGIENDLKAVYTPIKWNIPDDYNDWSGEKKRRFVTKCINRKASDNDGMKMENFRSKIIEKYLNIEKRGRRKN